MMKVLVRIIRMSRNGRFLPIEMLVFFFQVSLRKVLCGQDGRVKAVINIPTVKGGFES